MKALNKLDQFSQSFTFSIFGKEKFHNTVGIFLTFIFYTLVSIFLMVFGIDVVQRKNPKVMVEHHEPFTHVNKALSNKHFVYAWRIENEGSDPVAFEGMLYPKVFYKKFKKNKPYFRKFF